MLCVFRHITSIINHLKQGCAFHSISVCKVILEFRLESKLNKNDFLAVEGGGEG